MTSKRRNHPHGGGKSVRPQDRTREDAAKKFEPVPETRALELDRIEDDQELSAELANRLQPQLGNQAVQNLLHRARTQGSQAGLAGLEEDEEEDEGIEEAERESVDIDLPQLAGSIGGGGGHNPWDTGPVFGGDDDDDDDLVPSEQPRSDGPPVEVIHGASPRPTYDDDPNALQPAHVAPFEEVLGAPPARDETERTGDAVYQTVEASLTDPARIGRQQLDPEALVDRSGPLDPVGRATSIARFLSRAAEARRARDMARLIGGAVAALAPPAGGAAGGVARLAALSVCAEAMEGGGPTTDRACAVALRRDAWRAAVAAARQTARSGDLAAPSILAKALNEEVPAASKAADGSPAAPDPLRKVPSPLARRAIDHLLPIGPVPPIPEPDLAPPPPIETGDEDEAIAAADAVLARFTGAPDPSDAPSPPFLTRTHLAPVLKAFEALLGSIGRAQVECAAGGIAVRGVRPDAPVHAVLAQADRALRALARAAFAAGDDLRRLEGAPLSLALPHIEKGRARGRRIGAELARIRNDVLDRLAATIEG